MRWLHTPEDVEPTLPPDEPWCGEFDEHDCLGADCPRRPMGRDIGFAPMTDAIGLRLPVASTALPDPN